MNRWSAKNVARKTRGLGIGSLAMMLCGASMPAWSSHGEEDVVTAVAMQPSFDGWLAAFRTEAAVKGVSEATLNKALTGLTPLEKIVELDRKQPEFTLAFEDYLKRIVNPSKVTRGRQKLKDYKAVLAKIEVKYGVPASVLVALWGAESDYGRLAGRLPVIQCLATLAYEGRRATFFRAELLNALKIVDAGHVEPAAMVGSWAGAMGQTQFMPSTFLTYGVDITGDGRIDLWNSPEDALASSANYLAKLGWKNDETWGREVAVPGDLPANLYGGQTKKSLQEWKKLGVTRPNGHELPGRDQLHAGLIQLEGHKKRVFLVYSNFDAIHEWNRSNQFSAAVGLLSDALAKGKHGG